jgi:DNA mismatch repair protein MutL
MIADASLTIIRERTDSPGQKRGLPHSEPFEKPVISDPLKAETHNLLRKDPAVPDTYEGTQKHAGGDVLRDERTVYTGSHQSSEEKSTSDETVIRDGMPVLADQEDIPSPQLPEMGQADLPAAPDRISPAVHAEQLSFLPAFLSEKSDSLRRMIGQVFDTYWLFEFDRKLYIMDQHAAHEKILFEQLMSEYDKRTISSQQLNPPIIVTLNAEDQAVLAGSQEAFRCLGFTVEPFGGSEFAIRSVPYDFGTIDPQNLFMSLLGQLGEISDGRISDLELYVRRVATEACKAAVKGGGAISFREAEALLSDLMKLSDPYHCPHGRPTIISITQTELEKKFKRIV